MAAKMAQSRPSQLSEEFVQDTSDDDDGSENDVASESPLVPEMRVGNGSGEKSGPSEEQEEEEEEEEEEERAKERRYPQESAGDPEREKLDASSGTSKRSREQDLSSKTLQPSKRPKRSDKNASVRIPAKPFKPPPGFEPIVLDASDYTALTTEAFSDLSGKQVWQISAPASVNLGAIKQFDIAAVLKGEPIFTDNDVSYIMQPIADSNDVLLLPQGANAAYKPAKSTLSRGFSLQVIEKQPSSNVLTEGLPSESSHNGLVFTAQEKGTMRPPREQPMGLKARYTPYGVISSEDMAETKPSSWKVNVVANGERSPTKINRTPPKPKTAIPASESTSRDTNEDRSATTRINGSPPKAAQPSAVESSGLQSSGNKKKKRSSKLVDNPGL